MILFSLCVQDVADMVERLSPVGRAVAFGRLYYGSRPELAGGLSKADIMDLVSTT